MPTKTNSNGTSKGTPRAARKTSTNSRASRAGLADFAWKLVVAVLIFALAYLLWSGLYVLLLTFAGVLLAILLSGRSRWLSERTGIRYGYALAIVVVALLLLVAGLCWLTANRLAAQTVQLSEQLPQSFQRIHDYLEAYPWGSFLLEKAPKAAESLVQDGQFSRLTGGFVSGAASVLVAIAVIFFVGVFGAAEPEVYRAGLLHLIPRAHRGRVEQAIDMTVYSLRAWLVGQLILMVMMAVTTTIALWLIGIPLALTLGVIAGVLELIPYIGPWVSAALAALIALLVSPWHLAMVLVLYLALHILEGYILVPLVQRKTVHLPPALTVVSQFLLGELLGVLGLFIAAPLTVTAIVFLRLLYVEDTLGDKTVQAPVQAAPESAAADEAKPARDKQLQS